MLTANPGQTVTIIESGIPTGEVVGFQVMKAGSGTVAIGRTTAGVIERPVGSGNYVIVFVAPAEGDLYLVVTDWTGGVLAPETTRIQELQINAAVESEPGVLGTVAEYAKASLGGEVWNGLLGSANFGPNSIALAISVVKSRVFKTPPDTAGEVTLHPLVLAYLGKLVALELIPPARDYWANQYIAQSIGDDPTETVTFPNRAAILNDLRDDLLRQLRSDAAVAIGLIEAPRLLLVGDGPEIDEDDSSVRATDDPRTFPPASDFPYAALPATGVKI